MITVNSIFSVKLVRSEKKSYVVYVYRNSKPSLGCKRTFKKKEHAIIHYYRMCEIFKW
jgi:hypothetical protein